MVDNLNSFAAMSQNTSSIPRAPESVTAMAANEHLTAYMQSYGTYGPAAAQVRPAAGQLQAQDMNALTPRSTIVPFADRNNPSLPFDPRLRFNADPPSSVPEPASIGLFLCAGLSALVGLRRKFRNLGA